MAVTTSRSRRMLFRLLAVALGCLPFLVIEAALRWSQWQPVVFPIDPLVDLHHLRPLFTPNEDATRYSIGPERLQLFRPQQFVMPKPPGTFRIFALGGSTTQGEPYSTETAFAEWLRLDLEVASGGRTIEAINCGGLSYASYRVRAILDEVLNYQPDLIVIYCGQNEFLERRSYDGWRDVPLPLVRASGWASQLRTVQWVRSWTQSHTDRAAESPRNRTALKQEVDALLDYSGGLAEYHRDDPWREPVVAHFEFNLQHMVAACLRQRVPVVLCNPVVNLLDCPPMKFETSMNLSAQQREEFEREFHAAQEPNQTREQIQDHLVKAYEIDPDHAGVNFFLGRIAYESGEWEQAHRYLLAAKENDVCPLRALVAIQEAVARTAQQFQVPLLDADAIFKEHSPHQLVGQRWLVDHIHPTVEGHQLLGDQLCELCLKQHWIETKDPDWLENKQSKVREHLKGLGEDYFQRGKQRLAGLLLWTQGRAKKVSPSSTEQR